MRIFKCLFTGSECLCDNNVPLAEEGCMYKVVGKHIEIGGEDYGIAANADEDAGEGAEGEGGESKKERVIDLVHNNRLMETSFDKASYMAYIKGYMKALMEKIKEDSTKDADYIKEFAASAQTFVKKVAGSIDDWQFFYPDMGDEADYDAAICILCFWEGGDVPTFYYFKDGLKGEKV